ncbi:Pycsar system effector family protein [Micromonospora sp. CA-248260]|uniref:Pycsar system effector family protein n=1 Tax=Micromonospora sp. CA-248260 TaxID=3239962 RepID=UPI003D8F042B
MVPVPDPVWFTDRITEVRAELARADTKASTLMAVAGAAVTVGVAILARTDLPGPALAAGVTTVALVGTAVGLLAGAVRPCLGGGHGLVHYAAAAPGDLITEATAPPLSAAAERAHHLVWLSRTAVRKYRRVRTAVDLLLAGLVGTALTALLATLA